MKRFARRGIGVIIGLALGWWAAASWQGTHVAYANDEPAHATSDPHEKPHAPHDHGAAGQLVPAHEDAPFYGKTIGWIVTIAAAAIVVGVFLRMLGEQDPGVRASEEDQRAAAHDHHDDHARGDDHGHGHGDAHGGHGGGHH